MAGRVLVGLALALAGANAPIQCATRRGPEAQREDTPGDALWRLAERFGTEGNIAARRSTLEFLIERYPDSRFAQRARAELPAAPGDGGSDR